MNSVFEKNPFSVISPENLSADEVDRLLVEVVPDFNQIGNVGHAIVMGARGTGKSMMFRSLLPDVQMMRVGKKFKDLPFLAFHVPIKNAQLHLTDLARLDDTQVSSLINEHFLVLSIFIVVLKALKALCGHDCDDGDKNMNDFFCESFAEGLSACGCASIPKSCPTSTLKEMFAWMYKYALSLHQDFMKFVMSIRQEVDGKDIRYDLPLLSYQMFLLPFLAGLKKLPDFPDANVYLLIDDADNLSMTQTRVLNTWLSSRTSLDVSIKVSTQLGKYKTFYNVNNVFVESPHDYLEINISERYSKDFVHYYKRVKEIVEKRLVRAGIQNDALSYFPTCADQETAIKKITDRIKESHLCDGRVCRDNDAPRYARANYIRDLGEKNARHTYRYAGFEQLVWLSSGVVRSFLDAAATMYDSNRGDGVAAFNPQVSIPFQVQDSVVRSRADDRMFLQFAKLSIDKSQMYDAELVRRLQNLVSSIGVTFHNKLVSDASSRRFSSIALTNSPTAEIRKVFDYGVENGYFHVSAIGNKTGSRKTLLYSLNKSLFPHFNLDPIGDYGALYVTNDSLMEAILSARAMREAPTEEAIRQLDLFNQFGDEETIGNEV